MTRPRETPSGHSLLAGLPISSTTWPRNAAWVTPAPLGALSVTIGKDAQWEAR
jgi:hypothetical protein